MKVAATLKEECCSQGHFLNIENGTYLFKLKDLHDMFTNCLQALSITKTINKTRLKDDIMGNFLGHCVEETDGKNTILVFKQGLKKYA